MSLSLLLSLTAAGCGGNGGGGDGGAPDMASSADLALPGGPTDLGTSDAGAADLKQGPNYQRGEYLSKIVFACGDCHTPLDPKTMKPVLDPLQYLGGGTAFDVPAGDGGAGKVYASNLTPDKATGLGDWQVGDIVNALKKGVDKDGKALSAVMPYPIYSNLTDDDAMSIALFLQQSVSAFNHAVPKNTVTTAAPAPLVDGTAVPHSPNAHPAEEQGRYVAILLCLDCHTQNRPGTRLPDLTRAFAGGKVMKSGMTSVASSNITPDPTGIPSGNAGYLLVQFALKYGRESAQGRNLCKPMPVYPNELSLSGDVSNMASYLSNIPGIKNGPFGCTDGGVPQNVPDGG